MYRATVDVTKARLLRARGVDVTAERQPGGRQGHGAGGARGPGRRRVARAAGERRDRRRVRRRPGGAGYNVWRDNDGPSGFDATARQLAQANPQLLKLVTLGTAPTNGGQANTAATKSGQCAGL